MTKDLKMTTVKIWWKFIIMQLTRKFSDFWDIHFKVITRIMTYNIIPEHVRFLEISCNGWNIYINIFPYKKPKESLVLVVFLFVCFCFFILQVLISHQFYTHQCIHVNPNRPFQHTTIPTPLQFSPLGVHTFVLYLCVSTSALQTGSSVPFF